MPPLHYFILIYFCVYTHIRGKQTYWNIRKNNTSFTAWPKWIPWCLVAACVCRFVVGQKPFHKSISSAFDCYLLIYDDIIWNDARCTLTHTRTHSLAQIRNERERDSVKEIEWKTELFHTFITHQHLILYGIDIHLHASQWWLDF